MALERKIYSAVEDIVGPENITEEPATLDTYAFQFAAEALLGEKFMARPEAVVLPGSTEEVQAIVKACNRYKIKYKAFSTGWIASAGCGTEGVIQLDLRRMNRILELNEKDMYAVVEPYVIWAQLQAEAMKVSLNCPIIEAGSNTSPLASLTSMMGAGSKGISMGMNERNVLGVEWVLPTGEILRLGSVGSGAGWFCGDGPGPSLRGIMRGFMGAMGGLGVFTKAAIKLYHWPGPPGFFPLKGQSPTYDADVPATFKTYYVFLPTWKDFADAGYKMGEAGIVSELMKVSGALAGTFVTRSNEETRRMLPILKALVGDWHGFHIVLESGSQREFEYKEKVLDQILEETHGRKLPLIEHPDMQARVISTTIRTSTPSRAVFRPTGAFSSVIGAMETMDVSATQMEVCTENKKKWVEQGLFMDDGVENAWGIIYQHSDFTHLEELDLYDPSDPESSAAATQDLQDGLVAFTTKELGGHGFQMGDMLHTINAPVMMDYPHWMHRIKKEFDPNMAADGNFYTNVQE